MVREGVVSPHSSNSPARYPTIRLNLDIIYLAIASDLTSEGFSPITSNINHKPKSLPVFLTDWLQVENFYDLLLGFARVANRLQRDILLTK